MTRYAIGTAAKNPSAALQAVQAGGRSGARRLRNDEVGHEASAGQHDHHVDDEREGPQVAAGQ